MFIIFAQAKQKNNEETEQRERTTKERELLYLLRLYNELKGREGVAATLANLERDIAVLVELLKIM